MPPHCYGRRTEGGRDEETERGGKSPPESLLVIPGARQMRDVIDKAGSSAVYSCGFFKTCSRVDIYLDKAPSGQPRSHRNPKMSDRDKYETCVCLVLQILKAGCSKLTYIPAELRSCFSRWCKGQYENSRGVKKG